MWASLMPSRTGHPFPYNSGRAHWNQSKHNISFMTSLMMRVSKRTKHTTDMKFNAIHFVFDFVFRLAKTFSLTQYNHSHKTFSLWFHLDSNKNTNMTNLSKHFISIVVQSKRISRMPWVYLKCHWIFICTSLNYML